MNPSQGGSFCQWNHCWGGGRSSQESDPGVGSLRGRPLFAAPPPHVVQPISQKLVSEGGGGGLPSSTALTSTRRSFPLAGPVSFRPPLLQRLLSFVGKAGVIVPSPPLPWLSPGRSACQALSLASWRLLLLLLLFLAQELLLAVEAKEGGTPPFFWEGRVIQKSILQ